MSCRFSHPFVLLLLSLALCWPATSASGADKLASVKDVIHSAVGDAVKRHCSTLRQEEAPLSTDRCQRVCPVGFTACAGHCYALQLTAANYTAAERRCAELDGAWLAVPRSHADNLCVAGLSGGRRVWLGVTDRRREGAFVAVDGTPVSQLAGHRWAHGQPDDFRHVDPAGEDCVEMATAFRFAEWNDESCASRLHAMCQRD